MGRSRGPLQFVGQEMEFVEVQSRDVIKQLYLTRDKSRDAAQHTPLSRKLRTQLN